MRFSGVDEEGFDSLFRRSLVVAINGQFANASTVHRMGGPVEAAKQGVFQKDPTLKAFLKDARTVAVSLKKVHGFAVCTSLKKCVEIIEEYVASKDGGMTFKSIRSACNLPEMPCPTSSREAVAEAVGEAGADIATLSSSGIEPSTPIVPTIPQSLDPAAMAARVLEADAKILINGLIELRRDIGNLEKPQNGWETKHLPKTEL